MIDPRKRSPRLAKLLGNYHILLLNYDIPEARTRATAEHPAETQESITFAGNNAGIWPATCNSLTMDAQRLPHYASGARFPTTHYRSKATNRGCLLLRRGIHLDVLLQLNDIALALQYCALPKGVSDT